MTTIQNLSDHLLVNALVTRLGAWLDGHALGDPEELFTGDVEIHTRGGTARGVAAAVAQARRNHVGLVQTFTTNIHVDLQGDRASVRANQLVVFVPDPASPQLRRTVAGVYTWDTVRTPGGWRIARLQMTPTWESAAQEVAG